MKDKISNFELGSLNYFLTRAFFTGITFNCIVTLIKQDSWIVPLTNLIVGIIFLIIIIYIMNYESKLNMAEKIITLFNKKIGFLIIGTFSLFSFFICILNYLNLNNFIHSQFLNKTPVIAISIMFIIAIIYVLFKGINIICRTSLILFYIGVVLFLLSFIGLSPSIEIGNIKPIFQLNFNSYIKSSNFYYAYNIVPMILLTIIPKDKIKNSNLKKTLMLSYLLSAVSLFIVIFTTMSTFGYELSLLYQYPEFHVLKHISLIGLNTRIESLLVIQWLFDMFIFTVFSIYFLSMNINIIIKIKSIKILQFVICFCLVIATLFLSKYSIFLNNISKNILPFPITIFTLIMLIIICIKIKISK